MTRYLSTAAAALVLAGFMIDLAGGRWGAYIGTPISGLYLADALWISGAALALLSTRKILQYGRLVILGASVSLLYAVIAFLFYATDADSVTSLLLRDVSTFGYLGLVPLTALALSRLRVLEFIWIVRIATGSQLLLFLATRIWAIPDAVSGFLGGPTLQAMAFPGRSDILGLTMAIGVLSWGSFPRTTPAVIPLQLAMTLVGFSQPSRAGILAVLLALMWVIIATVRQKQRRRAVFLAALFLGTSLSWSIIVAQFPTQTVGVLSSANQQADKAGSEGDAVTVTRFNSPAVAVPMRGTEGARIDTYRDVIEYVHENNLHLIGDALGQPDTLLRACGFSLEQYRSQVQGKCDIDYGGDELPLRDPHNWILNLVLYHGVLGLLLFIGALSTYWWRARRSQAPLAITGTPTVLYLSVGMLGVVISSPFGMLPMATFTAFALAKSKGNALKEGTNRLA